MVPDELKWTGCSLPCPPARTFICDTELGLEEVWPRHMLLPEDMDAREAGRASRNLQMDVIRRLIGPLTILISRPRKTRKLHIRASC